MDCTSASPYNECVLQTRGVPNGVGLATGETKPDPDGGSDAPLVERKKAVSSTAKSSESSLETLFASSPSWSFVYATSLFSPSSMMTMMFVVLDLCIGGVFCFNG